MRWNGIRRMLHGLLGLGLLLVCLAIYAAEPFRKAPPDDRKSDSRSVIVLDEPNRVKTPRRHFGRQGTLEMSFRLPRTLRGKGEPVDLIRSDALSARIEPRRDSVRIVTRFGPAMTGVPPGEKGTPAAAAKGYTFQCLFTHLEGDRLYHAAWTWDRADASRNGLFLDGVRQDDAPAYDYPGQLQAASSDLDTVIGEAGLAVGPRNFYNRPLGGKELLAICRESNHGGYVDEGVRFTGEKFVPTDVDFEHPLYETSFDNESVLRDWRLEGGRRMSVQDGNLVLESDTKSLKSESDANHLVCWLTKEVPADFLLEFTVRPQNRRRGLNIVFFNARGLNGENIFKPPIQPRNGLFRQYHTGDLNNYHISYWSGGRGTANLRKNKGFYLGAVGKDLVYTAPADAFQTVRVYKRAGKIRLMVDDVVSLMFDDDGKTYGPVHTHSGWIGLRQMGHTHRCEYGHLKIWPLR